MIGQATELSKIEQRRLERKPNKRKNRRRKITRHSCKECNEPKHYICFNHNSDVRRYSKVERFFKRLRYKTKKLFFYLGKNFE
ncbi:MAG TPA: hypothetical protein VGC76_13055 [Pyrinomonadaceae bacterium]|jgi:hypothetical protein